jgi:uroporphyrin-3 C-methyltransferase
MDELEPSAATPPTASGREPAAGLPARAPAFASRGMLALFALLLVGVSLLLWIDARRDTAALREDAARRLTLAEGASTQAKERDDRFAGEIREMQAKLALLETRLAESQSQQAALEALYRELSPSRDDLALAEVEQVLLIANQQLSLAGNVPAALAALQLADGKLARVDRPAFGPLRRAIARDVERLKAIPFVDVTAITLKLDAAIAQIDSLPLARDERLPPPQAEPPAAGQPAWRRWLADAWSEIRGLVRLEVSERPAAPLIGRDQAYFLRENLRLRLLGARIAILARQEASFKADLRAAQAWVRQYFDTRTKPVAALADSLGQMLSAPRGDDLPDLSASLDAVRALKAAQDRRLTPPIPARPNR